MQNCLQCGANVSPTANYCEHCGTALSVDQATASGGDQEILDLLQAGQKLEAIKRHRERTGAGLKESKDYVESLTQRHGVIARPAGAIGCASLILLMLGLTCVVLATVF